MEEIAGTRFPSVEKDILENRKKIWRLAQTEQ
jgi:hypothetical protein